MPQIRAEHVERDTWNPWQNLAIAIVKMAAEDYRMLNKALSRSNDMEKDMLIQGKILEIRSFFLGEWFNVLIEDCDGAAILARLDKEVNGYNECS